MERPLYRRTRTTALDGGPIEADLDDIDSSAMFDQLHVDRDALLETVLAQLGPAGQVALDRLLEEVPLEQGLAELVGYLSLREPGIETVFDEDTRRLATWTDESHSKRVADMPRVLFTRIEETHS